jgi:hypothetical protein
MAHCAELLDRVLTATTSLGDDAYVLGEHVREQVRAAVRQLCRRFPLPAYACTA